MSMEESLLRPKKRSELEGRERLVLTRDVFTQEAKKLAYIAGPMVVTITSLYLLLVISNMMVGHLGELALSSAAISVSFCNVTGMSLLNGLASALETLCGQAYGAQQYQKVGHQTYGAMFSLVLVASLVSLVWINMEKVLILIGQDPIIAHEAGRFTLWTVPTLFAYAIFQPLSRYLQIQSLTIPMLASSVVTLLLHIPLCWFLVFKSGLENVGGALAISISNWLNVIFLLLYMKYSSACAKTRAPVSMEMFHGIGEFFRFAIPSAVMICLQWWAYEIVVLLSGLLSNPQLETSVLSVCLTTTSTLYSIPYGIGAAVSTRVSNELGAGRPQAARIAVYTVMILAIIEVIIVSGTLFGTRDIFGYSFSNEKEVVDYVSNMTPLVCLSVILDGLQVVLSGVARGCGWQHIGAYVNLAAFYLCGVPVAAILGLWLQLKARGLWIGIQVGGILQTVLLSLITSCTNWEKQASDARERIFEERYSVENVLEH
ncbi:PREDICTED: MATE efflux family protein 5-like isoform X2 [Populus euphratica]|nr:PREDICTED: MATE efflux family protein 5-like isoform X2 [Populus euphratica]